MKLSDPWTALTVILTLGLFTAALFVKGFTHDFFLEAGVFLVSVKVVLVAGNNAKALKRLEQRVEEIRRFLTK